MTDAPCDTDRDCDDDDANRYPGNHESCGLDEPEHDEDCDPTTFGELDQDADGVVSAACCNEDGEGETHCGTDCDDKNFRRFPDHLSDPGPPYKPPINFHSVDFVKVANR